MEEKGRSQRSVLPVEQCPWLVYSYGKGLRNQLFCSLTQPHKIYSKSIPALRGHTEIVAQCRGWFVLSKQEDTHFSLWNPTNSNNSIIQLPPLKPDPERDLSHCALTSPPGDPNSKVILLAYSSIIFIRPEKDKQWTEIPYGSKLKINEYHAVALEYSRFLHCCVVCNGKLYSFTSTCDGYYKLVTINVDKDNLIEYVPCQTANSLITNSFCPTFLRWLVECGGELLIVHIGFAGIRWKEIVEVQVIKLNFVTMRWERAESLMGQSVFIVGPSSCTIEAIGDGIESDCIYFTCLVDKDLDEGLYSYNVRDCCLSVSLPCSTVPTSWKCSMFLVPHDVCSWRSSRTQKDHTTQDQDEQSEEIQIEKSQKTTFLDLPLGLLTDIADHLNLYDYLSFRIVSRNCHLMVPELRRREALQRLKTCPSSPWLLFPNNDMTVFKIVDSVHGNRFLINLPQSLRGNIVRYSRNGWLMMSDGEASVSFFNLFSEEIIILPDPRRGFSRSCCMAFSTLPTSQDCEVVGCFSLSLGPTQSALEATIATMGTKRWQVFQRGANSGSWLNTNSPVFFKGSFYFLSQGGNLSTLKYKEELVELDVHQSISWDILENPKRPICTSVDQNFLVELDGTLVSIFVGRKGKWVQVFRLNFNTMSWERVESIGNYVVYVSRSSCFSIEAGSIGTGNRIYFPRFGRENSIIYYSLKTMRFHWDDNEGTLEGFYNTKEPLSATWIDPRCAQLSF